MSKTIGNFEIVGRLQAHAGDASYLARDVTNGVSATVDVWTTETPEAQSRFLDCAKASVRLDHDGIARILDFGIDGATSCRIEEFADGETLATKLRKSGDLQRETLLAWLAQIARALEYAHGMGVVHGDLHPGMVTIRPDGAAQLRGFANPRTTGKLRHRAPELIRGEDVDGRTDAYAFGVLLHRLLVGAPNGKPNGKPNPPGRSNARPSLPLDDLPADFPRRLVSVLEGCLPEDPAQRVGNLSSVVAAVEAAIHDPDDATVSAEEALPPARVDGRAAFSARISTMRSRASAPEAPPEGLGAGSRSTSSSWDSATMVAAREGNANGGPTVDIPVQTSKNGDHAPLVDVELRGSESAKRESRTKSDSAQRESAKREPAKSEAAKSEAGTNGTGTNGTGENGTGTNVQSPPSLETVAEAIKRPSRFRFRRRWLTFATVAGSAIWLGGTLWWSQSSPAVAGSEVPSAVAEPSPEPAEADRFLPTDDVFASDETPDDSPDTSSDVSSDVSSNVSSNDLPSAPNATPPTGPAPSRLDAIAPTAVRATGRLALAPSWHPEITVAVADEEPVVLDRRRVFEVEADTDHVLTFELATRDYRIREQVVARVPRDRLLETPVPLVRPGFLSVAAAEESARPVFVRVGDEAIGWTPIADLQVPVGTHVISVFQNPTWRPEEKLEQQISVRSRQETIVQFDLESEPPALIVDGRRIEYAPIDAEPGA